MPVLKFSDQLLSDILKIRVQREEYLHIVRLPAVDQNLHFVFSTDVDAAAAGVLFEDVLNKGEGGGAHDLFAAVQFHAFFEDVVMRDLDVLDHGQELGDFAGGGVHCGAFNERAIQFYAP